MDDSLIRLAIPAFFLLTGVEMLAARILERDVYRLADSVSDLSCGILQQLVDVFLRTALFAGYAWLHATHRLFDVPADAAWAGAACFATRGTSTATTAVRSSSGTGSSARSPRSGARPSTA
jgi:hypothetical protein